MELTLLVGWKCRLKLLAECNKLWAEGDKLLAEGNKLWAELIIETFGNIELEWKIWNEQYQSYECHLENGEVYGFNNLDIKNEDKEVKDAINILEKKGKIRDGKIIV